MKLTFGLFAIFYFYLLYRSAYLAATPLEDYKQGARHYQKNIRESSVYVGRHHYYGGGRHRGK
ncbi:hypothetical protein ACFL35_06780 [Candidatus Riflebacteria bacterium]